MLCIIAEILLYVVFRSPIVCNISVRLSDSLKNNICVCPVCGLRLDYNDILYLIVRHVVRCRYNIRNNRLNYKLIESNRSIYFFVYCSFTTISLFAPYSILMEYFLRVGGIIQLWLPPWLRRETFTD